MKIGILTSNRAELGIITPLARILREDHDLRLLSFEHHYKKLHDSITQVRDTGFEVTRYLSREQQKKQDDLLIIPCDRYEMLFASCVALHTNQKILHLHGGEKSGTKDDKNRNAISQLADYHFVATRRSGRNLMRMGIKPNKILVTGAFALKNKYNLFKAEVVADTLRLHNMHELVLSVLHPCGQTNEELDEYFKALTCFNAVHIYPNGDVGSEEIIKRIKASGQPCFNNLSHPMYFSLLNVCSVLVGNTSSGIIESPKYGIHYVLVGDRQDGREAASNIIKASYDYVSLMGRINFAVTRVMKPCGNPYDLKVSELDILEFLWKIEAAL